MKIDKTKLYDSYYKDDDGKKYPMYANDESIYEPLKNSKYLTKHYHRACERTDEICDEQGKRLGVVGQSWNNKLVTAMVRSGDFDAREAIIVVTDCCERCLNILLKMYLNKPCTEESYLSSKWERPCDFCDPEDDKYIEINKQDKTIQRANIPTTNGGTTSV